MYLYYITLGTLFLKSMMQEVLSSKIYFLRNIQKKKPQTHKDTYISIIFTDSLHYR